MRHFVRGIAELPCWRVGRSYGDELKLHFGARNVGPKLFHPRLGEWQREYGDWRVGSQGSEWQAVRPGGVVVASSRQPAEDAEKALKMLEGRSVLSTDVSEALELVIRFDDGTNLTFQPSDPDEGVPHWEVFAPGHRILIAGPGSNHVIKRSDP